MRTKAEIALYKRQWYQKNKARLNKKHSDWVKLNRETHRQYVRTSDAKNKCKRKVYHDAYYKSERGKEVMARVRRKYPEKIRCRTLFNRALNCGKVVRQSCKICGEQAEAHHENYNEPLIVVWLCRPHHAELHRRAK